MLALVAGWGTAESQQVALSDHLFERCLVCNELCDAAIFVEQGLAVCRIGNKSKGTVTWRYAFNAGAPVVQGFEAAREFAL